MPAGAARRVLVLGADGFIGRHVIARLAAAGHAPLCVARRTAALQAQGYDTLHADLADPATHDPAFWRPHTDDAAALVNAAGLLEGSEAAFRAVHHDAPRAAYAALPDTARVVLISAIGIEADTPFARHRRAGEDIARAAGRPLTILRPGLVLGETSYGGSSLLRALAAMPLAMPVVGDGTQQVNPMHAGDLADLVLRAVEGALDGGPHETGGAERLTQAELTARLRAWMGRPPAPVLRVPLPLARAAGRLGSAMRLGPISANAVAQLEHGIASAPPPATTTRPARAFLAARPAGTQDLWHARLYLMRPLLRLVLALLWAVSGLLGLLLPAQEVLAAAGDALPGPAALALGRAGGVLDLAIAAALLAGWRPRLMAWVQLAVVAGYTAGLTLLTPALWLDPFGALLKNLPILALLLVHRVLEEER
jgi:uncharacterized protein YbjT (DUF2867 family)/uncharacterized membrane protein YphA (DoxX/SURF4 family)